MSNETGAIQPVEALAKLAPFPGLFSRDRLLVARDLYAFDNVFTSTTDRTSAQVEQIGS